MDTRTSSTTDNTLVQAIVVPIVIMMLILPFLIIACHFWCNPKASASYFFAGVLKLLYHCCCCRPDCTSNLDLEEAISRHGEDQPLDKNKFIDELTSNPMMVLILTTINKKNPDYFFSVLPSGSLREGFGKMEPSTSPLATDYDVMLVPDSVLAGEKGTQYRGKETPVFTLTETDQHKPGFMWLRLENEYLKQWEKLCIRRQTQGEGCSYLSSFKIQEMIKGTLTSSKAAEVTHEIPNASGNFKLKVKQSGPAMTVMIKKLKKKNLATAEFEDTTVGKCERFCYCCSFCLSCPCLYPSPEMTLFYCDFTPAIYCPQWPSKAEGEFSPHYS